MAGIGKLDRRITLLRVTEINTPTGYDDEEREICNVWASRTDVSDSEKVATKAVQGTVMSRFVLRASSLSASLKPKDRLREGGRIFDITGIKEKAPAHFEITAEARLD